ncbi:MAG: lipopolysaccharide biosynthesis protein [Bacteroidota bacterium]
MVGFIKQILTNKNFLSLASNMSVAVFGFFSFILLTRTLTKDHFGEWVLFITAGNFLEMLRFGITRTAIVRFLAGAEGKERETLIGSNWIIGLIVSATIAVILLLARFTFPDLTVSSGYRLFFLWYPLLAFLNLPFNNALSILQADQDFLKVLIVRIVQTGSFVIFLIFNLFILGYAVDVVVGVYLVLQLVTSIFTMVVQWDGIKYIRKASREANKIILNFGKYTTGTLIGSNLLKSSDTFILGISTFMSTTGVAMYSVPLKLTEIIEIPIRSFMATAYPMMSKASINKNYQEFKKIYYTYAGAITYLLVPVAVIGFIFAEEFVIILGGRQYIHTADIFRIFAIYGLLLPIDRFTGVALDSLNRPRKNFFKVIWMTLANIIGDVFVIFVVMKYALGVALITLIFNTGLAFDNLFPASAQFSFYFTLQGVALVTILMTIVGMLVGYGYLRKEIDVHMRKILVEGLYFYQDYWVKFKSKLKNKTL